MFKKALIASAVLAATSGIAFANGAVYQPVVPHCVHSVYLGAAISRDRGHWDFNSTNTFYVPGFQPFFTDYRSIDLSGEGVGGELFAGINATFYDRWMIGLEGFGDVTSNDGHANFSTYTPGNPVFAFPTVATTNNYKMEQEWAAGVALLPGVKVTESTEFYGRVGYINSEFEYTNNTSTITSGVLTSSGHFKAEENLSGLQLGLGLEAMCTQNIGIRTEYDFNYYEDFNPRFAVANVLNTGINFRQNNNFDHPIVDQFKLGLDYHIGAA